MPSVDLEFKKGLQAAVSLRNDDYRRICPEAEFADMHYLLPWLFAYLRLCEDGFWHQHNWI